MCDNGCNGNGCGGNNGNGCGGKKVKILEIDTTPEPKEDSTLTDEMGPVGDWEPVLSHEEMVDVLASMVARVEMLGFGELHDPVLNKLEDLRGERARVQIEAMIALAGGPYRRR